MLDFHNLEFLMRNSTTKKYDDMNIEKKTFENIGEGKEFILSFAF